MTEEEGMFNLVGSPDDPQLEEVEVPDDLVEVAGRQVSREDVETAHEALEKVREVSEKVGRVVSPFNVVFASIIMALLIFTSFAFVFWVVPRDAVTVDVYYMQSGPGHVVLAELHNYGTQDITDITVVIVFEDEDGNVLNSTRFYRDNLPAHTSIAGDDLELMVGGASVWGSYRLTIELEYTYYDGDVSEDWSHEVGDWASEYFVEKADRHWF